MKRLFINLPFLALFFCSAYWRELQWLESLAFAAGLILVCLTAIVCSFTILSSDAKCREFTAEHWPNGKGRTLSVNISMCICVGLAIAGFPIMAAIYAVFCVISTAALISAEKG